MPRGAAKHVNVSFQPPADLGTFDGDLVTSYSIFYACGPNCVKLLEDSESSEVKVIRGLEATLRCRSLARTTLEMDL